MTQRIIALVALALLFIMGIAGVQAAVLNSGEQANFENEQFTADVGNVTQLNNSGLPVVYDESVTVEKVKNNGNTQTLIEGQDYEWVRSNGTVKTLSGGELNDGDTAEIDYGYNAPDEEESAFATIAGYGINFGSFFLIVIGVGIVVGSVKVLRRVA
jgi:hypothetical protein